MSKLNFNSLVLGLAVIFGASMFVVPGASAGTRDSKKIGIDLGLLTAPFPSVWGLNLGINTGSFARLGAGVGFTSATTQSGTTATDINATTISGEVKLMVPDWSFTPTASVGITYVTLSKTAASELNSLPGFTESGSSGYFGFGLDWQTGVGFNIGLDYKMLMSSGTPGAPGIYFGWYF